MAKTSNSIAALRRNQSRELYPDVLRILAMIAVITLHVCAGKSVTLSIVSWEWQAANIGNSLSRWCVPVFLMVSSTFILDPDKEIGIRRLYGKYVTKVVLMLLVWGGAYQILLGSRDIRIIIGNIFQGNVHYHLYFLLYLIGLYILVPVLRIFTKGASQKEWMYFFAAWLLVSSIMPLLSTFQPFSSSLSGLLPKINLNFFSNYTGFFLFGYYIKKFQPSKRACIWLYIAGTLGGLWTIIGTTILSIQNDQLVETFYNYSQPNIVIMSAAVFVFVKSIVEKRSYSQKQVHLIHRLSSYTFGVFLLHDVFLWLFLREPMQLLADLTLPTPLYILLITALVCVLSFGVMWVWFALKPTFLRMLTYIWKNTQKALQQPDEFDRQPARRYIHCSITLLTTLFIVLIFGPVYISRNNNTLLDSNFLLLITIICGVISLLLACFAFVLKNNYKYLSCMLTGLLLLCFINATIIPFQATILDGRDLVAVQDNIIPVIRNIIFLLICIITGIILRKNLKFIAVPLLTFCVIFTLYNQYIIKQTYNTVPPKKNKEEVLQSATAFSTGKNIIVIGVDALQGTIAEKTFINNPEYLNIFDGFTVFTRTFSSFPFTNYSRPTIQSGNEYSTSDIGYIQNVKESIIDSFMMDMQNAGVRTDALGVSLYNIVPAISTFSSPAGPRYMYGHASAASVARITGYWPSNPFFGDAINLMLNTKLDSVKAHKIIEENFTIGDNADKCLYFWDYTLHYPISLNQDGNVNDKNAESTNEWATIEETVFEYKQLQALFDHMKANNVYDNSMIIIVSDHGHPGGSTKEHLSSFDDDFSGYKNNGNYMLINRYNAVLFVKPPYARGEAELTYNAAWNGDVRSIINYYYSHFENVSPLDVVARIRALKPKVKVMFGVNLNEDIPQQSTKFHQTVEVGSLYEIPAAFSKKSGIIDP